MSTTIALIATRPHTYKDPHLNSPLIAGWKSVLPFLISHSYVFPLTLPIVIGSTGILACAAYLVQCEHKDSASRSHHDENLFTIFILIR